MRVDKCVLLTTGSSYSFSLSNSITAMFCTRLVRRSYKYPASSGCSTDNTLSIDGSFLRPERPKRCLSPETAFATPICAIDFTFPISTPSSRVDVHSAVTGVAPF